MPAALDLLSYHHHLWRRFAEFYETDCSWAELSRDFGSSHGSIANVTMHAVNMEDWYLHCLVPGKPWDGPAWDGFRDAASMARRIAEVETKTRRWVAGLGAADLAKSVTIDPGDGAVETTLEAILLEVVNEATHHRGEVLAMLWQMDREPPYESYLEFSRSRARQP